MNPVIFFLLFQDVLATWDCLHFPLNFEISLSIFTPNPADILIEILDQPQDYSSSLLPTRETFRDPQQMPETTDRNKLYIYYVISVHMFKKFLLSKFEDLIGFYLRNSMNWAASHPATKGYSKVCTK